MLTASAVVLAPVLPTPPPAPEPAVRLIASVTPTQLSPQPPLPTNQRRSSETLIGPSIASVDLPNLLIDWLERIIVPPSASAPFPEPDFPAVVGGNSIDSAIKNVYNAIEPWVEWGFDVAAYAVGWIPYVGWLAPQIEIIYNLVERIVRSITFNVADWLGGDISFWDGLGNVVVDTVNSFIYFANDELAFWLPPLPPIPPIGPLAAKDADAGLAMTSLFDESTEPAGTEARGEEEELTLAEKPIQEEFIGEEEELTLGDELPQEEVPSELDVDLNTDGEIEEIEEIEADEDDEQIDIELTVDERTEETEAADDIDTDIGTDTDTTNSFGTGEIRESTTGEPTGRTPTPNDDGAQKNTADQGGDRGNTTTAK